MKNLSKKLAVAVLTAATLITTTVSPVMCAPCTSIEAVAANYADVKLYASTKHMATEKEASAAHRTWQGDYIDPTDITSCDEIEIMCTGDTSPYAADSRLLSANDKDAFMRPVSTIESLATHKTACMRITQYNGTDYDLYYTADLSTGVWYQTLNTAPCADNAVINTVTTELYGDPGDKVINPNGDKTYINGFDWVMGNTSITMNYEDVVHEKNTNLVSIVKIVDGTSASKGSIQYFKVYELFGPTWLCTHINCDARGKFTYMSSDKNIDATIAENAWVKTNGKKGDRIEVTKLFNAVDERPLLETHDNDDDLAVIKSSYVLKEDNEALPVAYGNYIIHNKSTGIYETVTSWAPEDSDWDYRLIESVDAALDRHIDTHGEDITMDFLSATGIHDFIRDKDWPEYCTVYDVPKTLNIASPEYTTLIRICDEYPGDEVQIGYVFDTRSDAALNTKVMSAVTAFKKRLEKTSILPYFDVTVYDVPTNTTPTLAYYATDTMYTNTSIQNYGEIIISHIDSIDPTDRGIRINSYVKEIGAKTVKRTTVMKSGKDTSIPSYNGIEGDANQDGVFSVADIVMMQKWLLGTPDATEAMNAASCAACNLYKDDVLDVFDLVFMKRALIGAYE